MNIKWIKDLKNWSWYFWILISLETGLIGYFHVYSMGTGENTIREMLSLGLFAAAFYLSIAWLIAKEWRITYSWKDPLLLKKVFIIFLCGMSVGGQPVYQHLSPLTFEMVSSAVDILLLLHISMIGLEELHKRKEAKKKSKM